MSKKKNPYKLTIVSLYVNYILQGMATIIITQNMLPLMKQLNTNMRGISLVVSSIGVGRIISLFIAGRLSDKKGRKFVVWLGMLSYIVFFGGLVMSKSLVTGILVTLFAGFANAFLDTGTYPTLIEAYPESHALLSVLNKFFISVGQFILPLLVSFFTFKGISYRYSFLICLLILCLNSIYMVFSKYPTKERIREADKSLDKITMLEKPKFHVEGIAAIVFGFTSVSTFNIALMWLPEFGEKVSLMAHNSSLKLISIYSVGSIISVFLTASLVKKIIKPLTMIVICPFLTIVSLLLLILNPTPTICRVVSFLIGVFASGGIWQLALSIFLEMFPESKGITTGYYTLATSFSVMLIPIITGYLNTYNHYSVFLFNIVITTIGLVATIVINYRYKKIFNLKKRNKKLTLTPRKKDKAIG